MKLKTKILQTTLLILALIFAHCSGDKGKADAFRSLLLLFTDSRGEEKMESLRPPVITGTDYTDGATVTPAEFKALVDKATKSGLPVPVVGSTPPAGSGQVGSMTPEELAVQMRQGEIENKVQYDKLLNNQNIPEEIRQRIAADQKKSAADFAANGQRIQNQAGTLDRPSLKDAVAKAVKDGKVVVAGVEIPVGK